MLTGNRKTCKPRPAGLACNFTLSMPARKVISIPAFAKAHELQTQALMVAFDAFFNARSAQLATLSLRYAIPAIYPARDFAEAGGLMSYGADLRDMYRQAGIYAGRILKGEKPADLPVVQASKFEMVINLKAAKTIGLTLSPDVISIADEVIE